MTFNSRLRRSSALTEEQICLSVGLCVVPASWAGSGEAKSSRVESNRVSPPCSEPDRAGAAGAAAAVAVRVMPLCLYRTAVCC